MVKQHIARCFIAGRHIWHASFQHGMAFHTKLGSSGGSLADMVGLDRPLRHDHVGTGILCRCHQEFQLACLVAARGKSGAIIALDPQARPTQRSGQARHLLKRRWLVAEMNSPEIRQQILHVHSPD